MSAPSDEKERRTDYCGWHLVGARICHWALTVT